jgi:hypothetical protein
MALTGKLTFLIFNIYYLSDEVNMDEPQGVVACIR